MLNEVRIGTVPVPDNIMRDYLPTLFSKKLSFLIIYLGISVTQKMKYRHIYLHTKNSSKRNTTNIKNYFFLNYCYGQFDMCVHIHLDTYDDILIMQCYFILLKMICLLPLPLFHPGHRAVSSARNI